MSQKKVDNVTQIRKIMKEHGLDFQPIELGDAHGKIYTLKDTSAKIYIRGSQSVTLDKDREPFRQATYYLFGNLEDGLYCFGLIQDLRKEPKEKSFSIDTKHGGKSIEDIVADIKNILKNDKN